MAIVHDTDTKNAIADVVCGTRLDGGATLVFLTNTLIVIGTITLDSNAFASAINGDAAANGFPKTCTATAAGTISQFQILDASSVVRITGAVTTEGGGGDIELSSVAYVVGETITLNSLDYRVPN